MSPSWVKICRNKRSQFRPLLGAKQTSIDTPVFGKSQVRTLFKGQYDLSLDWMSERDIFPDGDIGDRDYDQARYFAAK